MFKLVTLEDAIRIPPDRFGEDIDNVGYEQLKMKYDGMVDEELGYVIAVTQIKVNRSSQRSRKSSRGKL